MVSRILRNVKSFSGAMISVIIILIVALFLLNWAAKRGWGPVSTVAGWAETHATGSAYATPAPVVGVPSSNLGPAL